MYTKMENITAIDLNEQIKRVVLWNSLFLGLEIILGLIGNTTVLYVFVRRYKRCNFRFFVLCLAVLDMLGVLIAMPGEIVTLMFWYIYPPIPAFCKMKAFFNIFTVFGQAFCLLLIAVDRYRKIRAPHGWQISQRLAFALCVLIFVATGIISLPVPFLWGIRSFNDTTTNVTVTVCEKDGRHVNNWEHPLDISVIMAGIGAVLTATIALYIPITCTILTSESNDSVTMTKMKEQKQKEPKDVTSIPSIQVSEHMDIKDTAFYDKDTKSNTSYMPTSINIKTIVLGIHTVSESDITSSEFKETTSTLCFDTFKDETSSMTDEETSQNTKETIVTTTKIPLDKNTCITVFDRNLKHDILNKEKQSLRKRQFRNRARRITRVPLVLSIIFTLTSVLYLSLLFVLGRDSNLVKELSNMRKAFYFFGLRLVFINHVINPFVYWVLDREFKKAVKQIFNKPCNICC
ncbi:hypothetical protein DPMN_166513 [Dreissena polymorpha]|uniref:G-protein coupled receptors family 1 profile domain-containing protein n=1 Tax=Dreissena polymorpha TaxID=45954 RepID=A0A9D4IVJ3_DREPO|nr:hypothetical protein DPMN_166513 [Dreissena polymorpha]